MEQILQMFEELKGLIEGLTTQGANLSEQAKHDRALLQADQENLAILNEEFNTFTGEVREDKDIVERSLQRTQKELGQTTNVLNMTHAIVDKHGLAKKIELPSTQGSKTHYLVVGRPASE
ncbi:hypothetical protein ACLB2K_004219 [Fragaria x ananassa]